MGLGFSIDLKLRYVTTSDLKTLDVGEEKSGSHSTEKKLKLICEKLIDCKKDITNCTLQKIQQVDLHASLA